MKNPIFRRTEYKTLERGAWPSVDPVPLMGILRCEALITPAAAIPTNADGSLLYIYERICLQT